ncbi:MAG: transglutaminase-like cysteine peptidase [Notoacmeibacter sp.]
MKYKIKSVQAVLLLSATAFFQMSGFAYAASGMNLTSETTQPIGHYELCQRLPSECRVLRGNAAPVALTQKLWSRLVDVNSAVNSMVKPVTDMEMWGKEEVWSYPSNKGDCEDYVLLKRKILMKSGISENNLLITVVRQSDGSGHAVLTVSTDQGDFVLDNLQSDVRIWNETGYSFLKRQSAKNSGQWVGIDHAGNSSVAALK